MSRAFLAESIDPLVFHEFLDAGFRRSGRVVYQMACPRCRECVPIRIPVAGFSKSADQRRVWNRNRDLVLSVASQQPTEEKFQLYRRYVVEWHGGDEPTYDEFVDFLYSSPVHTLEFEHRDRAGKLLCVGVCDVCPKSLSSVYCYFDPAESKRSLGTLAALDEIKFCQMNRIPHYYLGYLVNDCPRMSYKNRFRPYETLGTDGVWREPLPEL